MGLESGVTQIKRIRMSTRCSTHGLQLQNEMALGLLVRYLNSQETGLTNNEKCRENKECLLYLTKFCFAKLMGIVIMVIVSCRSNSLFFCPAQGHYRSLVYDDKRKVDMDCIR